MRIPATTIALSCALFGFGCGGGGSDAKDPSSTSSGSDATSKDSASKGGTPKAGDTAPPFTLDSLNGAGKATVGPGKVTIVDFWATWCEPCKKSFPKYAELYTKYKASGLEIVGVSVDDEKGEIPGFAKTYGAKFPVGWDDGHKIASKWSPPGMPSAFILDKKGVVRFVHQGYKPGEEEEIEKQVKSLL